MKLRNLFNVLVTTLFIFSTSLINAQDYKEIEKSFPLEKDGKVSINTYKGSVEVETWDKAEVYVYAKMEADDNWDCTEPEEQLEDVEIDFSSSASHVRIKSDYYNRNSNGCNTLALVHYKIKMPKSSSINIDDHKSNISIDGIAGYVDVNCYKGEIDLINISGEIDLETYKGIADVDITELTDDCRFNTYKGDIEIKLPKAAEFSLDVDIEKKGDFDCDFDFNAGSSSRRHKDYNFRADVNGGGHYIEVSSYKGYISIREK